MTTFAPPAVAPSAPVLPMRALAHDGDEAFIVERAPNPPMSAARRFRTEAAPVAARIAEQVRVARDLMEGAALDTGARAAVGQGLQRVVIELRALAESYDVAAVADVCRAREAAAATLDPRAVAGVEHVAHGLLGAVAEQAPEAAQSAPEAPLPEAPLPEAPRPEAPRPAAPEPETSEPAVADQSLTPPADVVAPAAFRPPTGPALVELLEHGITGIERFPGTPLDMPAVPAVSAPPIEGVVAIDQLCYRGRAALDRARAIRDELRSADSAPDRDLLDELYDLLDLAALD